MKISIIGNASSGKSTLAAKTSERLGVPWIHLDRYWFEGGGHEAERWKDPAERIRINDEMMRRFDADTAGGSWVSDGWYSRLQQGITDRADMLVFLDIPLSRRLWNHARRMFRSDRHQELTLRDELKFFAEIVRRASSHDPKMRAFVEKNKSKAIVIKSYAEADRWLRTVSIDFSTHT